MASVSASELLTVLNVTGLQQRDQKLYDFLRRLLTNLGQTQSSGAVAATTSGGSTTTVNNTIIQQLLLSEGQDGNDGNPGRDGTVGTIGPIGLTGATGAIGPATFLIGETEEPLNLMIPGVQGPQGNPGSAGGAIIFLGSATASSSASLDLTSLISATYDEYILEINDLVVDTNGTTGRLLFSTNNGSTWAATTYNYNIVAYPSGSTSGTSNNSSGTTSFLIGGSYTGAAFNTTSGYSWSATIQIRSVNSTSLWKKIYGHGVYAGNNSNATSISEWIGGAWETITAVNALQVKPSSGLWVSGNARLYAISKT